MSGEDLRLRAEMGDVEGLKLALSGGANPCSRDHMGLTALHYAVWNGHLNCVEVLCANHIGVDDVAIEARKQAEEEERIAKEKAEKKARKEAKKKAKEGGAGSATNTVVSPTSKFAQRKQHEAEQKRGDEKHQVRGGVGQSLISLIFGGKNTAPEPESKDMCRNPMRDSNPPSTAAMAAPGCAAAGWSWCSSSR